MQPYPGRPRRAHGISAAVLLAAAVAALPAFADPAPPEFLTDFSSARVPPPDYCVRLENGVIHTMDAANTVVSSVTIQDGKFTVVGLGAPANNCIPAKVIDLGGHTVVPGIIDNHNHIILLGLRPGHDVRIENAVTVREVLGAFEARAAEIPAGEWLTALGGFNINQFVPPPGTPRFPTLNELNIVTPKHPVLLMQGFTGPCQTNSRGKALLEPLGVTVGADGSIATGTPCLTALNQLRRQDEANRLPNWKRGTVYAMTYASAMGITTHLDQGGFPALNDNTDGLANFDRYRAFDAMLELNKEHKLTNRIRVNFLHLEDDLATPELTDRLKNAHPNFGDDWLKVHGIGEFTANGYAQGSQQWKNGTRLVARLYPDTFRAPPEGGEWTNENHSLTTQDFKVIIDEWTKVNQELIDAGVPDGLTKRRWVVAHVPFITQEYIDKLQAIGGGISLVGGWRYISGNPGQAGPPFRMILDSGIHSGLSSDGMQISPMNPWLGMYYAITGKNARGVLINDGQQITRQEALRLYTADNGWFLKEEATLGTIEVGKKADLTVLSADYFNPATVSDEAIKNIESKFTMVNGSIVWDDLNDQQKKHWDRDWRKAHGFHW
jgi:predicted amidohydrolase YtcJ